LCRDITDEDRPFQSERWHHFLEAQLPWWTKWTSRAMDRLADAVPDSHHTRDAGDSSFWSPSDEFYNSVELLNRVLFIPRIPPFFAWQEKIGATVGENWLNWPSYSRASLLLELHPWFFAHVPSLRQLLTTVITTEVSPHVVKHAIGHVARTNSGDVPQEFELLFQRADSENFHKSFFKVGEWLGRQMIPSPGTPGDEPVNVNAEVLNDWLERPWRSDDLFRAFASGVLDGARDSLVLHKESKASVYQNWLDVVSTVIPQWRFAGTDDDTKDFPIVAIRGVLENESSPDSRLSLFTSFTNSFIHLMRHGSLGVFSDIHHLIVDMIQGRSPHSERQQQPMGISPHTDAILLRLCQTSVERIRDWKTKGKTTNDLDWGTALNGKESAKLIRSCLSVCRDPSSFATSAIALCDVLASAGQAGLSAELRLELRRV